MDHGMDPRRPLPHGDEKRRAIRALFDAISPRYDLVNRVMTLGLDQVWRRRAVRELHLPPGSRVLDLACGTGDLCRELARNGHRPVGFDFSHGMLVRARTRTRLVEADVVRLPVRDACADGVTCGFALRNLVSLEDFFREVARVVRPGGAIALLDASEPESSLLRTGHRLYVHTIVPIIGGTLSDRDAYEYLPRSLAYLPPADEMLRMLVRAGFPSCRRLQLTGGAAQLYVGVRA
jgi:demethylmenaquinone methyltransferase / 2-methoxy-6-polyprenyl-1,4-benzoquinol methylase